MSIDSIAVKPRKSTCAVWFFTARTDSPIFFNPACDCRQNHAWARIMHEPEKLHYFNSSLLHNIKVFIEIWYYLIVAPAKWSNKLNTQEHGLLFKASRTGVLISHTQVIRQPVDACWPADKIQYVLEIDALALQWSILFLWSVAVAKRRQSF